MNKPKRYTDAKPRCNFGVHESKYEYRQCGQYAKHFGMLMPADGAGQRVGLCDEHFRRAKIEYQDFFPMYVLGDTSFRGRFVEGAAP